MYLNTFSAYSVKSCKKHLQHVTIQMKAFELYFVFDKVEQDIF